MCTEQEVVTFRSLDYLQLRHWLEQKSAAVAAAGGPGEKYDELTAELDRSARVVRRELGGALPLTAFVRCTAQI